MNFYPRSLLRLILIGWVFMALPLLLAIAYAAISYARLAGHSEAVMQQVAQATRLGWTLDEDLVHLERVLRQYEVLRDRSLLDDYAAARKTWHDNGTLLAQIPLLESLAGQITAMRTQETAAYADWQVVGDARLGAMRTLLADLQQNTGTLNSDINRLAQDEQLSFRAQAEALRQRLLIAVLAASALAGTLFWLGRRTVSRLLKSVERAVILLGNNVLEHPIQIKGPNDLRWIGKRLDWLRRRMQSLEQQRTRVLRHVSHELKTPLAALREGCSLIGEGVAGPLTPQQTKIARIMQGNILRLQALIDGLLRLQQAEYLRERGAPEPLRVDEIVRQTIATHQLAARDKQVRIDAVLPPLSIEGVREALTTIVDNLLANAIKFSPQHGTVNLQLCRSADKAILDVIDTGPGVPESDRRMIFEPFYRSPHTRAAAGVGLGLAIAREFAEAQRGSLECLAAPQGAHFRLVLPCTGEAA